jgi:DNA helicase-2/ATP-dependent DNA helicase PcrA
MPWLGTFHSICVKLLRRHAELVGLKSNFTILDTDDQVRLLKQLIRPNIDEKRWPARQLAGIIDGWKNRAWTPEKVPAAEAGAFNGKGAALYAQYQERLKVLNAVDFGDLLLHVVAIFQTHEDVLAQYQRWFRYILVDEYQDTNVAQYLWLRLLARAGTQHLLRRRRRSVDLWLARGRGGQHPAVREGFSRRQCGPAGAELPLHPAYPRRRLRRDRGQQGAGWARRSGPRRGRREGPPDRPLGRRGGGALDRRGDRGDAGHARHAIRSPDDMAILVRASHQMRAFEDRFLTIGLPYRVIGGPRFYERMEIRDAMAYFRVVVSPDDDLAFERIVNTPKRGLGDKAQQTIQRWRAHNGVSLLEGARMVSWRAGKGSGKGAGSSRLIDGIDRWRRRTLDGASAIIELAERSSTSRLHRACGRTTRRPRRRAGWKTSRNWSRRWRSSRTCRGSSNMSR